VPLPLLLALAAAHEEERVAVEFVVTAPAATPAGASLYVAGNLEELGEWRPDGVELEAGDDSRHRARVVVPRDAQLEFKVTRGTWAEVEKGEGGVEIPNRRHRAEADATLEIAVASWADAGVRSTVTGTLERHPGFGARSGLRARPIHVWLPDLYAQRPELRFSVLYMHDGQNLFDATRSFSGGEWHVDETCDRLMRAGAIRPLIVVGIENTRDRMAEYTPTSDARRPIGGRAAEHARMVLDEVKPFVDGRYRTLSDRDHTFVGGSSLGGLVSLHLLHAHADVFGGAAALSPALTWDREWMRREWERAPPRLPVRLWIDIGTREGSLDAGPGESAGIRTREWIAGLRAFAATLERTGLRRDVDFAAREIEGARHTERAWAARFEEVARFLFAAPPAPGETPAPADGGERAGDRY